MMFAPLDSIPLTKKIITSLDVLIKNIILNHKQDVTLVSHFLCVVVNVHLKFHQSETF
jgi:hypothetical protein